MLINLACFATSHPLQVSFECTSCNTGSGIVGCCPFKNGVCCDDLKHCCPNGYICDGKNRCTGQDSSSPYIHQNAPSPKSIVCKDGKTSCPDKNTCCPSLVPGTYGCCPKPEAVCCEDNRCCPHGYSCGSSSSDRCSHENFGLLIFSKPVSLHVGDSCGNGSLVCGMNDTCCQHPDNTWGCCPAPNAVCCEDGHHCCPENYTCDKAGSACKKNSRTEAIKIIDRPMSGMQPPL